MVNKGILVAIFIIFCHSLFAQTPNALDYKVVQLLGVEDYRINQKFIQRLFSNQDDFLDQNGQPSLHKISKVLKQNGLLKLAFEEPMELEVTFVITEHPQTFISTLYDV